MFFPIKCQGKDHSGIWKTKTEEIIAHLCCELIDLVITKMMGALMNVLQLPWLFSGPLIHTIFNRTQNIFPD